MSQPLVTRRSARFLQRNLPLVLILGLLLAARSSLADHYVVPTGSMEYTLLPGDRIFVDKTAYGLRLPFTPVELAAGDAPAPGEVVIFDSPEDGRRLVKRVVAVAGERVTLRDGHLLVDGRPLASAGTPPLERFGERSAALNLKYGGGPDLRDAVVPDGHVLVLGDSRGHSRDSRFFGFIPERSRYGRAVGVYYRRGRGLTCGGLLIVRFGTAWKVFECVVAAHDVHRSE